MPRVFLHSHKGVERWLFLSMKAVLLRHQPSTFCFAQGCTSGLRVLQLWTITLTALWASFWCCLIGHVSFMSSFQILSNSSSLNDILDNVPDDWIDQVPISQLMFRDKISDLRKMSTKQWSPQQVPCLVLPCQFPLRLQWFPSPIRARTNVLVCLWPCPFYASEWPLLSLPGSCVFRRCAGRHW